jgi:coatomer subunit beta'
MVQLGHETPVASMDKSGKLVVAINNVISTAAVRLSGEGALEDGNRIPLALKELGNVEQYPQTVAHNANGRFVATCGDNEYVIYTAQVRGGGGGWCDGVQVQVARHAAVGVLARP